MELRTLEYVHKKADDKRRSLDVLLSHVSRNLSHLIIVYTIDICIHTLVFSDVMWYDCTFDLCVTHKVSANKYHIDFINESYKLTVPTCHLELIDNYNKEFGIEND